MGIVVLIIIALIVLSRIDFVLDYSKACKKHYWTMRRIPGTREDYLVCRECGLTPDEVIEE